MKQNLAIQPSDHGSWKSSPRNHLLVVDDDRMMRMVLGQQLVKLGYQVTNAENGKEALDILQASPNAFAAILLDREMPVMGGMEVISAIKRDLVLRSIPIIMQTGSNHPEQIRQGIDAGVFYYLTKPIDGDVLKSVIAAAVRESQQHHFLLQMMTSQGDAFNLIESGRFFFNRLQEAESLAVLVANAFPDSQRVLTGLAELFINAVEHGILGISYQQKTELVSNNSWREEVERRTEIPLFRNRKAEVVVQKKPEGVFVQVTDPGEGFNWRDYLHIDPARAGHNHGRGIAHANLISFDRLRYTDKGNSVIAAVLYEGDDEKKDISW